MRSTEAGRPVELLARLLTIAEITARGGRKSYFETFLLALA